VFGTLRIIVLTKLFVGGVVLGLMASIGREGRLPMKMLRDLVRWGHKFSEWGCSHSQQVAAQNV
jgi:hypothetical protein